MGVKESPLQGEHIFTLTRRLRNKTDEMNTIELKENWDGQKDKLKKKFGYLIDNYLMFEEGKKEVILRKLQIKLGKTKAEVLKIIADL